MLGFIFLDFASILFNNFLWIPLIRLKDAIRSIARVYRRASRPELEGSGGGGLLVKRYGELRRSDDSAAAAAAEMCSICLTEFAREDFVYELKNCCHIFHFDCIEKWNRFTCPLCRCVFNIENRHEKELFYRFLVPDNPSCLYYFLQ